MQISTQYARPLILPATALLVMGCAQKDVFSEEPPLGSLKRGEVVLVDDGSCPAGEIKQVTAANRALAQPRSRVCVTR